jgi:hypothetical protein
MDRGFLAYILSIQVVKTAKSNFPSRKSDKRHKVDWKGYKA